MWSQNALTDRLNLKWPILQAPMGSFSTPALAAAVGNAGGLGGLGMWGFSGEDAERRIAGFRQQSGGSLNVNYPIWLDPGDVANAGKTMRARLQTIYDSKDLGAVPEPRASGSELSPEHLAVLQKSRPEVASFHFGMPNRDIVDALKAAGIFILSSATTVAEARALETAGADGIIAQGIEAGGHRGTFSGVAASEQPGLFSLLPQIVDAVGIPVIATGGIADGRAIAAALMLGASGAQIGTAFLRCAEADVNDTFRATLANSGDTSTTVTHVVSGKPARVIRNHLVDELSEVAEDTLPFPAQLGLTMPLSASGDREVTPMFAGQSVGLTRPLAADDLVAVLAEETNQQLKAFD